MGIERFQEPVEGVEEIQVEVVRPTQQPQSEIGVLLVHGLNGGLRDMEELTEGLAAHGMLTENMLLPGHGTHVRAMLSIGWPQWSQVVHQEVRKLRSRCKRVFLVGHSLGGALCLHVAATEEITGIVTMCAPLHMYPWMRPMIRVAKYVMPLVPTVREDVCDPEARRRYRRDVYRWTPMAPVASMLQYLPLLREQLPYVTAPALIMSALHDHVVPVSDGDAIYRLLGSQEKQLVTFSRSYHVLMKDHDRKEVFAMTLDFIQRYAQ